MDNVGEDIYLVSRSVEFAFLSGACAYIFVSLKHASIFQDQYLRTVNYDGKVVPTGNRKYITSEKLAQARGLNFSSS